MGKKFKIYVTGDAGEDLLTCSVEGNRPTRPAGFDHQGDTSHDVSVPSGASFIFEALSSLLPRELVHVDSLVCGTKTGLKNAKLTPLDPILTQLSVYSGDILRIKSSINLSKKRDKPTSNWAAFPAPEANDLVIIHFCNKFDLIENGSHRDAADGHMRVLFQRTGTGIKTLVNLKTLPKIEYDKPNKRLRFAFCTAFWQSLQLCSDSVGIVVSASALRRAGAAISTGLSWEQTTEDLTTELYHFPALRLLSDFAHLFIRIESFGIIHVHNSNGKRRGHLYFVPDGKEVDKRDPDRNGHISCKNTLLLASLAYHISKPSSDLPKTDFRAPIKAALRAMLTIYDRGYGKGRILDQRFSNGEDLIKEIVSSATDIVTALAHSTAAISLPGDDKKNDRKKLATIADRVIPEHLLTQPDPRELPTKHDWRMLDEMLSDTPTHRINVAIAVVKWGVEEVLNRIPPYADGSDREPVFLRPEGWNPQERSKNYRTLQESELPAMPPVFEKDFPMVPSTKPVALFVPVATFGKLTVVEREPIEALSSIKNLLSAYIKDPGRDKRPISIAVFGPPGSGKGFTIKQIADVIDPAKKSLEILEYNIAQFRSPEDLGQALTRVTSVNNQGRTPLVIFDEFDCGLEDKELGWLKFFLAPMQDGSFYGASDTIHFGRAIFAFVGGIYKSFDKFDPTGDEPLEHLGQRISDEQELWRRKFAERKGPDFISRLRGHIDIMGINSERGEEKHLLRRAITLRSLLEATGYLFPGDDGTKVASADEAVIYAFLTVDHYRHGVRSMEQLLRMCTPIDGQISAGSLPAEQQLSMHVDAANFYIRLYNGRARGYYPALLDDVAKSASSEERMQGGIGVASV